MGMARMQAVTFAAFGAPRVLEVRELERPEPGPGDVLVRVHAAGICYHDVLSRAGKIGGRPGRVLGHEIAGEIVAVGDGAAAERIGERVVIYQRLFCGSCRHCLRGRHDLCRTSRVLGEEGAGGYAEFACVPARNAIAIPDGLDMTAAALAVCPIGTSVRAALGVGRAGVVQARVLAVTSSQQKAQALRAAGADEVIVSADLKFSAEAWRLTQKQGADVVLDNVVTGTLRESLRACAQNATVVVLGNIAAQPVELDPGLVIMRRIRIAGSGNATFADVDTALHLLATGKVKPCIGCVLPFPKAAEGHAMLEQRAVTGRVVLQGW